MSKLYNASGQPLSEQELIERIVNLESMVYNPDGTLKNKTDLEYIRYKHDCKKRALDMAKDCMQIEYAEWEVKKEGDKPTIMSLANKYYGWLTGEL